MKKKKILIVEDSLYLAESLEDALEMHGYETIIAPNGRRGVELALAEKPDMILLDIRLPDISGYEVYQEIRSDSWGKKAKISVLTASESIDQISKNINLPLEHVLFKPNKSLRDIVQHIEDRA